MQTKVFLLVLCTQILSKFCKPAPSADQVTDDKIYFPTDDLLDRLSQNCEPETTVLAIVPRYMTDAKAEADSDRAKYDKIYFPANDLSNQPLENGKPETTTVGIAPRYMISAPPNCPPGHKLVGRRCRRVYRIQN